MKRELKFVIKSTDLICLLLFSVYLQRKKCFEQNNKGGNRVSAKHLTVIVTCDVSLVKYVMQDKFYLCFYYRFSVIRYIPACS